MKRTTAMPLPPAYYAPCAPQTQQPSDSYPSTPTLNAAATPGAVSAAPSSTERILGGKVVGVVAAILVLSGLVVLGGSFIPQLPNVAKAALIFLFAGSLTAAGALLVTKNRNAFTYALFTCGMVAFFVAIYASQNYLGVISHTSALVIAGLWTAATTALIALTRTWPLSVALAGTAGVMGVIFLEANAADGAYYASSDPLFAAAFALLCAYCMALGYLGVAIANKEGKATAGVLSSFAEGGTENTAAAERVRRASTKSLASVFVAEGALLLVALNSAWRYSEGAFLVILGAILLALKLAPLPASLAQSRMALRVNEVVALFVVATLFLAYGAAGGVSDLATVVMFGVFVIAAIALAGIRALDRIQPTYQATPAAIAVLFAAGLTGVVVNYVCGIAVVDPSPYLGSALCMACALVAIAAGFWFGEKPLRLFGLVVALLSVLKIALFDLAGDALVHAVALVVAGLICFAISALYTYTSKRLA